MTPPTLECKAIFHFLAVNLVKLHVPRSELLDLLPGAQVAGDLAVWNAMAAQSLEAVFIEIERLNLDHDAFYHGIEDGLCNIDDQPLSELPE